MAIPFVLLLSWLVSRSITKSVLGMLLRSQDNFLIHRNNKMGPRNSSPGRNHVTVEHPASWFGMSGPFWSPELGKEKFMNPAYPSKALAKQEGQSFISLVD